MGGARTALFNWLYAKHTQGTFLLRIEDTDLERSTDASREAILDGMAWLGLTPDEEVVLQSERRPVHVQLAETLLAEGKAYKCFCTPEELQEMRDRAMAEGRKPKYDGTWRDRSDHPQDGRPFTVRIKMPLEGETTLEDMVLGPITVGHEELDDLILLRSDGTPTYNFVVVCDDAFMRVTHVVRGQDHVSNTFRQVHIYDALGFPRPTFAHLPLIDGLSKRKGSASVQAYRDAGYLAEGVINYIARLGWSHGDQELFSVEELIALFDLKNVNAASGRYDEVKMAWVNQQWIKRLPTDVLQERLRPFLARHGWDASLLPDYGLLVEALRERGSTLVDLAEGARFAFERPDSYDEKGVAKWMKPEILQHYDHLVGALQALQAWVPAELAACVAGVAEASGVGMGKIAQPIRIALCGSPVSPPIDVTLAMLPKAEVLDRLAAARHLFSRS